PHPTLSPERCSGERALEAAVVVSGVPFAIAFRSRDNARRTTPGRTSMQSVKVYGLEKCSTCQKARTWLDRPKIEHQFSDYRAERVDPATLKTWAKAVGGWESLVNRSGMTWRNLPSARKTPGSDPEWLLLIKEYPALIRRPVVVQGDDVTLGFTDKLFSRLFSGAEAKK